MKSSVFNRAWQGFNGSAGKGNKLTRPQFKELVLKAPQLFQRYVVDAARLYQERGGR